MAESANQGAPRAVIFDLDGTLIDSAPDIVAAANATLTALGRGELPAARIRSFVGNGVGKLVERCLDATGGAAGDEAKAAHEAFGRIYEAGATALTRPYDGAVVMLTRLAKAGFALGICTNKPAALTEIILGELGLRSHFGVVLGGDSLPRMKPDPAPLLAAAAALGGGPALFVGDSEADEAAAANAGMPFLFFTGGYRRKPAAEFVADFSFADFDALADHVMGRQSGPPEP
ncbi:MAG: phosphoglycolate phosphatase [Paracoccaceae bacterium]